MPTQVALNGAQDSTLGRGLGQLLLKRVIDHGAGDHDEVIDHGGIDGAELVCMAMHLHRRWAISRKFWTTFGYFPP